jgi:hypothetical protein
VFIAHKALSRAKSRIRRGAFAIPLHLKKARLLRSNVPFTIEVGGAMGMGAMLAHACVSLRIANAADADAALSFTSPTYAPSGETGDWLEAYFVRHGPAPTGRQRIGVGAFPFPEPEPHTPDILWRYMSIRPELIDEAVELTGDEPFAAVHYRGSDKFIEVARVAEDAALDRLETEMRGLNRVFIASDEPAFIERAARRFGSAAFWLPCQAIATNGRPPHFMDAPGEVKAREALVTMVALSRAAICVRTPSFLSAWARTLNPQQRSIKLHAGIS